LLIFTRRQVPKKRMISKSYVIVFMCFIAYASSQTYTKLTFTDCGSKNLKINRFWYEPMPILHPAPGKLSFAVAANEPIKGVIKAELKIVRKVSGISLPIRCYVIEGEHVGSCVYPDLCALMKRIAPYEQGECPPDLAQYGIDCNCPVNINKTDLDVELDLTLPKAPEAVSWISVGDFDVKLTADVGNLHACYDIKFAVKPAK
jgi:hypothetical protein